MTVHEGVMEKGNPVFPVLVTGSDGEGWELSDEKELAQTLEWFDSGEPEEDAIVTDALGRRVSVKVEAHPDHGGRS